jgi:osmotically-inducible protein OsmY
VEEAMKKGIVLLSGVGIGAGLMYVFDPDRGKRRRALMRDKVEATSHRVVEKAGKLKRDLQNRAEGLVAETKAILKHEGVPDDVLVDRVRSKIGRFTSHPGAIQVEADNGMVTLRGPLLESEKDKLMRAVRLVRGVKDVDNQLQVHAQPDNVPALPGQAGAVTG